MIPYRYCSRYCNTTRKKKGRDSDERRGCRGDKEEEKYGAGDGGVMWERRFTMPKSVI